MGEFIKVPLTKQMIEDYGKCTDMMENNIEKDCNDCSCNGGNLGCMGEYPWCKNLEQLIGKRRDTDGKRQEPERTELCKD